MRNIDHRWFVLFLLKLIRIVSPKSLGRKNRNYIIINNSIISYYNNVTFFGSPSCVVVSFGHVLTFIDCFEFVPGKKDYL